MSKNSNSKETLEFVHTLDSIAIKKQKEEIDKLKYDVELWKLRSDNWQKFCELTRPDLYNENARLKAEVERLRKAGDALSKFAMHNDTSSELWIAWNAAKEGKQS